MRKLQMAIVLVSAGIITLASIARVEAGYAKQLRAGLPAPKPQQTVVATID